MHFLGSYCREISQLKTISQRIHYLTMVHEPVSHSIIMYTICMLYTVLAYLPYLTGQFDKAILKPA